MIYIERLHGYKPHIIETFKNWFEERVTLHGVMVNLTGEFIAELTGLPMEGIKFSKETSISNANFKKFPKMEAEEKNLEKNGDFYELNQIKVIWRDVLSCIREYFIPDGREKRVNEFYFIFLNHLGIKIRFPFNFFLKYSLLLSLYAHRKKDSHPMLHEGLILLIEFFCKSKAIKPSPIIEKRKGAGSGLHSRFLNRRGLRNMLSKLLNLRI